MVPAIVVRFCDAIYVMNDNEDFDDEFEDQSSKETEPQEDMAKMSKRQLAAMKNGLRRMFNLNVDAANSAKKSFSDPAIAKKWDETTEKNGRSAYGAKWVIKSQLTPEEAKQLGEILRLFIPNIVSIGKLLLAMNQGLPLEPTKDDDKTIDLFKSLGLTTKKKPGRKPKDENNKN